MRRVESNTAIVHVIKRIVKELINESQQKHILEFFSQKEGAVHFEGLLREFGGRHVKRELKNMLDDMAEDGEVIRLKGNSYSLPGKMKTDRGRISVHRDGYGFVTPDGGGEDIFIPSKFLKGALHGDLVEASSSPSRMGGTSWMDGSWRYLSVPPVALSAATRRPGVALLSSPMNSA